MLKRKTPLTYSETFEQIEERLKREGGSIDEGVRHIVKYLNDHDGIETFGCCGGHKPKKNSTLIEGNFYIVFVGEPKSVIKCWKKIINHLHTNKDVLDRAISLSNTKLEISYSPDSYIQEEYYRFNGVIKDFDWMK